MIGRRISFYDIGFCLLAFGFFALSAITLGEGVSPSEFLESAPEAFEAVDRFEIELEPLESSKDKPLLGALSSNIFSVLPGGIVEGSSPSQVVLAVMGHQNIDSLISQRQTLKQLHPEKTVVWALDDTFLWDIDARKCLKKIFGFVRDQGDEIGILYDYDWENHDQKGFIRFVQNWLYIYRYRGFPEFHVHDQKDHEQTWSDLPLSYRPQLFLSSLVEVRHMDWLKNQLGIHTFLIADQGL